MTVWLSSCAGPAPYSVGILGKEIYHSLPQFPPRDDIGIMLLVMVGRNNYTRKMFANSCQSVWQRYKIIIITSIVSP